MSLPVIDGNFIICNNKVLLLPIKISECFKPIEIKISSFPLTQQNIINNINKDNKIHGTPIKIQVLNSNTFKLTHEDSVLNLFPLLITIDKDNNAIVIDHIISF